MRNDCKSDNGILSRSSNFLSSHSTSTRMQKFVLKIGNESNPYKLFYNNPKEWNVSFPPSQIPSQSLVFLLLVLRRLCPLRCCWMRRVLDLVSFVSVSGVSGTTSFNPGRSGGGINSGVLIWDLCNFLFPRFGCV